MHRGQADLELLGQRGGPLPALDPFSEPGGLGIGELEGAASLLRLQRISLHGARHTFVTTALANGVAQNLVASYAGHTPATMNSVYWDALPGHGQAVAAVIGTVYGGVK